MSRSLNILEPHCSSLDSRITNSLESSDTLIGELITDSTVNDKARIMCMILSLSKYVVECYIRHMCLLTSFVNDYDILNILIVTTIYTDIDTR